MGIVAKYKYDGSVYADLIPEFNAEFINYTITDEVEGNIIIRTIESESLPTLMRFGRVWVDGETVADNRTDSLLEVLDMNTSGLTIIHSMFRYNKNLTSIICEWDINNVTIMYNMFAYCKNLTSLDVSNWDVSNVTNMSGMFYGCNKLTSLDVSNWNTSKVNDMIEMFANCANLTSLDVSNWDTSKVTNMAWMFAYCTKLTSLDVSNFDTSNVANIDNIFTRTPLLKDIGMIYCDKDTINKVASLLPTDHNITIWVESDDILQYDQYDHITYRTQKVQDTVHLNSPLLKGDTIEIIDGKTYHVHRYEKFVFDGSLNIDNLSNCFDGVNKYYNFVIPIEHTIYPKPTGNNQISDKLLKGNPYMDKNTFWILAQGTNMEFRLNIENLKTVDEYKQYLQANPVTVIYELATPYYELISEEPLELTLLDTTNNTINNNSILPSNMSIANKELSTIAIKPSTTYTLAFDKSNEDSEVTIDICGGEQVTTVGNMVQLTTPSELGSGIRFISSDGCIISNVRLIEGGLVEKAIPEESFEGLQSSFEDGYIIGEVLGTANSMTLINTKNEIQASDDIIYLPKTIKAKNPITLIFNTDIAHSNFRIGCYRNGEGSGFYNSVARLDKIGFTKYLVIPTIDITVIRLVNASSDSIKIGDMAKISNVVVLEGDHTHLSEVELMRYIEKGTSHYEEEDFNHVGKYKVEYRVTGKNKFNKNKELQAINYKFDSMNHQVDFNDDYIRVKYGLYGGAIYLGSIGSFKKGTYTVSCEYYLETLDTPSVNIGYFVNDNWKHRQSYSIVNFNTWDKFTYTFTLENDTDSLYLQIQASGSASKYNNLDFRVRNIQLEEGSTLTEYEPYKEYTKTFYLNSPLLEGDTIEDINGVATHVKRYGKIVLDGSNDEGWRTTTKKNNYTRCIIENFAKVNLNETQIQTINNSLPDVTFGNIYKLDIEGIAIAQTGNLSIKLADSRFGNTTNFGDKEYYSAFIAWLQANPLTVVYPLASPIREPISTESILCDSYVNGHLDVDTNIPIKKVYFDYLLLALKYVKPSTRYLLQFESDNVGISTINIGGSTVSEVSIIKGINKVEITTLPTLTHQLLAFSGIGFNASNIQVVADAIDDNGEVKEFDYFKGLKSSFEDGLITDVNDENYGKYKVECKIVGKNKFDGVWELGDISWDNGNYSNSTSSIRSINFMKVKEGQNLSFNYNSSENLAIRMYDKDKKYLGATELFSYKDKVYSGDTRQIPKDVCYMKIKINSTDINFQLQIEEGTQATSYEPYKESIHTLYLNSPLLKGDKIVVHNGKLCHYHKMGIVVLDGSKDEYWSKAGKYIPFIVIRNVGLKPGGNFGGDSTKEKVYVNTLQPNIITSTVETDNRKGMYVVGSGEYNEIRIRLTDNDTVDSIKQWLQQNPTTVVYELKEPYYEPIEPQVSQYSLPSVKDGDMEILTGLPIKIDLTYRTDINGVSSIEEQIASIQEGTDISSIIDEEVDE